MLKKKVAISVISVSVMAVAGIAAVPILSRMLSAESLGRFFAFLGLISLLQVLDGMRPAIVFNINKRLPQAQNYRSLFAAINRKFNYWVVPSLMCILGAFTDFEPEVIVLLSISYVAYTLMSLEWGLLEAKNDVNYPAMTRAVAWLLAYIGFVVLAYFEFDIKYCLLVMALMYVSLWGLYRRRVNEFYGQDKSQSVSEATHKDILSDVLKNIKIQLGAVLLTSADKIIFPQILGYSAFSHYAIQAELATKGYVVNSAVRRAIQPSYTMAQGRDVRSLVKAGGVFFCVATIAVWVVQFFAENLMVLYVGQQYATFAYLMPALLLVFPANILGTIGTTILHAKGHFGIHSKITAAAALLYIPMFVIAIYFQGIVGAVFVLVLSRLVDVSTFFLSLFDGYSNGVYKTLFTGLWFFGYVSLLSGLIVKNAVVSIVSMLTIFALTFAVIWFFCKHKNDDAQSA